MSEAIAIGYFVDRCVGEPPVAVHPLVWFGRYVTWLEDRVYAPRRSRGVAFVVAAIAPPIVVAVLVQRVAGRFVATALFASIAIGARMLSDEARSVGESLSGGDVAGARRRAQGLVGRDLSAAPAGQIARAVVESVAENSVDATAASLWWGAVAGAPGIAVHRAVNTLDAVVGHRSDRYERFGWAAARLDDALNFVPARLAAGAVVLAMPWRCGDIVRTIWRDGSAHPSPNAGVIEAAFAAALRIRLGGVNRYGGVTERRPDLGTGPSPSAPDIRRADELARRTYHAMLVLFVLPAVARVVARRGRARAVRCAV